MEFIYIEFVCSVLILDSILKETNVTNEEKKKFHVANVDAIFVIASCCHAVVDSVAVNKVSMVLPPKQLI